MSNQTNEQSLREWVTICEANVKSARTEEEKLHTNQRLDLAIKVLNNFKNTQEVL